MTTIHKMRLISTGGTIAGEVATSKKHEDFEIAKAEAFSEIIKDTVSDLMRSHQIELRIDPDEFDEVDSSDIKPDHWIGLARRIKDHYDEYDSFVITHGTNTMGYTCAALSFALLNLGKPVVVTGSQVPIRMPGSDAQSNLENAIRVATWPSDTKPFGVVCVFGSHIITGTRVKKNTEFDYDAFTSFSSGSLGRIGRIILFDKKNVQDHNSNHSKASYPIARRKEQLLCKNEFEQNIVSLTEFPGMKPEMLKTLHKEYKVKGFIIRAFGAGDMSTSFIDVLEFLKDQNVPVVVTTQAPNGNANLEVNEPGQLLKRRDLVIPAYDMSIESQTAKLMWLLAQVKNDEIKIDQLGSRFTEDLKGEVNVQWELDYYQ